MAGPWAGQVLADLAPTSSRWSGPARVMTHAAGARRFVDPSGKPTKEAGYYLSVNRGKRSITLDLDKPEGQAIVRAIAARSDIVLENFKAARSSASGSTTKAEDRQSEDHLLFDHRLRPDRAEA